jgi:hypothetical protein
MKRIKARIRRKFFASIAVFEREFLHATPHDARFSKNTRNSKPSIKDSVDRADTHVDLLLRSPTCTDG